MPRSMFRSARAMSVAVMLAGCRAAVATDGSPQAGLVRGWIEGSGAAAATGATLVMSDYGMPLTRSNLRVHGPDRIPGCALARVERSPQGATATWSCSGKVHPLRRRVEFVIRAGHIASASYVEADQARL